MKNVTIYTDGSAKGNPGPGGYGVVLIYKNTRKELSQGFRKTTNNRMELMGVIVALKALKEKCIVVIFSDSKYIVDAVNSEWITKWQANNWMRTKTKQVLNIDLWKELVKLLHLHNVTFRWIKGHSDSKENQRCDLLAVAAAEGQNLKIDNIFESILAGKANNLFSD